MDEKRKSVVLYTDKLDNLLNSGYSNDFIANVMRCLVDYLNNGGTDRANDQMAELYFNAAFKTDIDRNNHKWETTRERRRVAGRLGGLKRAENAAANQAPEPITPKQTEQEQANQVNACPEESTEITLTNPSEPTLPIVAEETINYKQLKEFWNNTLIAEGSGMPRLNDISEKRKKHIRARLRKFGKRAIMQVIENAAKSKFMSNNSFACFDWIFKSENNFQKVLDGNYNRESNNNTSSQRRNTPMSAMGQIIQDFNNGNFIDTNISTTNESTISSAYANGTDTDNSVGVLSE